MSIAVVPALAERPSFSDQMLHAQRIATAFGLAESTAKTYIREWKHFADWAKRENIIAMPADHRTILAYLAHRIERDKLAQQTTERIRSALALAHDVYSHVVDDATLANPANHRILLRALKGLHRAHPTSHTQKMELRYSELARIIDAIPDTTLTGKRDRALLALTWFGALRRSEVVALNVGDIEHTSSTVIVVHLRRSKTDKSGKGQTVPIATLPNAVSAASLLTEYVAAANITEGPIFRWLHKGHTVGQHRLSGQSVWAIVKRRSAAVGMNAVLFGAHSLRSGLATELAVSGVDLVAIMEHCRWTSAATARKYIRRASDLAGGATAKLKLIT